jgi:hypothetical protein
MAHFAKLDGENIVIEVVVVNNEDINDLDFPESELVGIAFLVSLFGEATWKQTSYNHNFRKNYAGIGYTYDLQRNAFIPPKPFESWILNEETCLWDSPVPLPDTTNQYRWDEVTQNWVLVSLTGS